MRQTLAEVAVPLLAAPPATGIVSLKVAPSQVRALAGQLSVRRDIGVQAYLRRDPRDRCPACGR
jgi:hypothetical protein